MPTVRVDGCRWKKLEEMAVKATVIKGKPVTVPEIIRGIIDEKLSKNERSND